MTSPIVCALWINLYHVPEGNKIGEKNRKDRKRMKASFGEREEKHI